jgi:hypothetical protein
MDFSIDGDIEDIGELKQRLFRALRDRLDAAGYVLFDEVINRRPTKVEVERPFWGGYEATFKVVSRAKYRQLGGDLEAIRRDSELSGLMGNRKFSLDLSRFEYCVGKVSFEVDSFVLYAYSPEMIVAEKLRAICQQMPAYNQRRHPAPRPRDFFDIHLLITRAGVDLSKREMLDVVRGFFKAKEVDLALLAEMGSQREFHRQQWPAVRDSIFDAAGLRDFDHYFDFVIDEARKLEFLRNPDVPPRG